jgi:hypothetical protein
MLMASPSLLARTEIKVLEADPRNVLEMHDLGAYMTPAIVIHTAQGPRLFQGPAAAQALISQT